MSTVTDLSEQAVALIRVHLSGRTLHMKGPRPDSLPDLTVEETRNVYRELVAAGLMIPISGFAHGPESHFRLTEDGWRRRREWLVTDSDPIPSVDSPPPRSPSGEPEPGR